MDYFDPIIKSIFRRLGLDGPKANTLVVQHSEITDIPSAKLWDILENVEQWSRWGKPWMERSRWLEKRKFEVGARFEQVRKMGIPIGRQVSVETVRELIPGVSVAWWDADGGIRSGRVWSFETQPDGKTKVTSSEVFVGPLVLLFRLLVQRYWNRLNAKLVTGLLEFAKRN